MARTHIIHNVGPIIILLVAFDVDTCNSQDFVMITQFRKIHKWSNIWQNLFWRVYKQKCVLMQMCDNVDLAYSTADNKQCRSL